VKSAVNGYRVQNGFHALRSSSLLDKSAKSRADYLCEKNLWSHDDWADSFVGYEKRGKIGENLEYGDIHQNTRTIVDSWANSETHNENMLDGSFVEQGMGVRLCEKYQGQQNMVIVVNHFGRPSW
jgi:uncharacterized protein YkwD